MSSLLGILEASVIGSICIFTFYVFSKLYDNKYTNKYKMMVWLLIAVRLLIPDHMGIGNPIATIEMPSYVLTEEKLQNQNLTNEDGNLKLGNVVLDDMIAERVEVDIIKENSFTIWDGLVLLWIMGAVLFASYYVILYVVTSKRLRKYSQVCTSEEIYQIVSLCAEKIKINRIPEIRMIQGYSSPFAIGFFRNVIYMPDLEYKENDLIYMIKHELFHCKNRDIIKKWFFLFVNAIHWFNPLVWMMNKLISQDIEFICDEEVLRDATKEERREYSELIMSCINTEKSMRWGISTGYMQSIKFMRQRFHNIFNLKKKGRGVVAIVGIICVMLLASCGIHIKAPVIVPNREYQAFNGTFENIPITVITHREDNLLTIYYTDKDRMESGKFTGTYDEVNHSFVLFEENLTVRLEGSYYTDSNGMLALKGKIISVDGSEGLIDTTYTRSYENHTGERAVFFQEGVWDYNPFEVLAFVDMFAEAIQRDDKEMLADMMSYPLTVGEDNENI